MPIKPDAMVADPVVRPADWLHLPIGRIEDLKDAIYQAGLKAMQISSAPLTGSLVVGMADGITVTSGNIGGRVMLDGPLSQDKLTIGIGLSIPAGTLHWMKEVGTGSIGVFLPGDEHEALYMPGSLYTALTLSGDELEERAARRGLTLDARMLGGTGFSRRKVGPAGTIPLRRVFSRIHRDPRAATLGPEQVSRSMLNLMIEHFGREPEPLSRPNPMAGYSGIVRRARDYIEANLAEPLSMDAIADAAFTSHRTLYRAFHAILDETPQQYISKLRLHRIRSDLATARDATCTVATVANEWGISELGRFSGHYRRHFGELPSKTLRHAVSGAETVRRANLAGSA